MKFKNGELLNWLERILSDERFPPILLFSLAFAIIYFYFVNQFLDIMLFRKLISVILVPMMVGGVIGMTLVKLMNIEYKILMENKTKKTKVGYQMDTKNGYRNL